MRTTPCMRDAHEYQLSLADLDLVLHRTISQHREAAANTADPIKRARIEGAASMAAEIHDGLVEAARRAS